MNFTINRVSMLTAAKNAEKVAPAGAFTNILSGILIECNDDTGEVFITATNFEVSIQQKRIASVDERGAILVNARLLVQMLASLESEFVCFAADSENRLRLSSAVGKSKFCVSYMSPSNYPKPVMPFPGEAVTVTSICSLAKRTTFAVSKDNSKAVLQCVYMKLTNNAVTAAASDGAKKLVLVKDSVEASEEREFMLPARALQKLASVSEDTDVFEVSDVGKEIVFVRGDMMLTIRKLTSDDYIDTTSLLKNIKPEYKAVADSSELKNALSLLSVSVHADTTIQPLNLSFSDGSITLLCRNEYSHADISVPAQVTQATPEKGFYYEVAALCKIFDVINGRVKLEIDARGSLLIKTPREVYYQVAMRGPVPVVKPKQTPKEKESAKGAEKVKKVA